jgi:integral membrane sensor domain MASE1
MAGLAVTAGVAAGYFAAARLGLSMAFVAEQVTVVWPPTGIAVAALVTFGPVAALGLFAGALAANATIGEPLPAAACIAAGNALAGVCAWWLLRRAGFGAALDRIWDVMALLGLAGAAASVVSATAGVLTLCLSGLQPWSAFDVLWWIWWAWCWWLRCCSPCRAGRAGRWRAPRRPRCCSPPLPEWRWWSSPAVCPP